MALIKCPECGKEVSDAAENCIHCGFPLKGHKEENSGESEQILNPEQKSENEEVSEEDSAAEDLQMPEEEPVAEDLQMSEEDLAADNSQTSEEQSGVEPQESENESTSILQDSSEEPASTNDSSKKKSNKRVLWIIVIVIVVIAICAIVGGVVHYNNVQKQKDERLAQAEKEKKTVEAYNFYIDNLNKCYVTALTGASDAESVCLLTEKVWYDAIFKNNTYGDETKQYVSGSSDFNEAIQKMYSDTDTQDTLSDIRSAQDSIGKYIANLQAPAAEFSKAYDEAIDLNSAFGLMANLALSPSGTYSEYSSNFSTYQSDFMSAYNTLTALIPEKEEVPVFDEDGYEIEDEFPYDIYLNQPKANLPSDLNGALSSLGYFTGEASICGIDGDMTYTAMSGLVEYISWTVEEPNGEDAAIILSKLEEKYGDYTKEEEDDDYHWSNDDILSFVVFSNKDDKLSISWTSYL